MNNLNQLDVIISAEVQEFVNNIDKATIKFKEFVRSVKSDSGEVNKSLDDTSSLDEIKHKLEETKARMAAVKQEIAGWQAAMDENKRDLVEYQALLAKLKTSNEGLGFEEWNKQVNEAKEAIESIPETNKYFEQQIKDEEKTYNKLVSEANSLQKEIDKAQKNTTKVTKEANKLIKAINGIRSLIKRMLIRKAIMQIVKDLKECLDLLARYDKSLGGILGYNKAISDMTSEFKKLTGTLAAITGELAIGLGPAITTAIKGLEWIAEKISMVLAMLNGKTEYTVANPDYWKDYAEEVEEANKEQRKLISGFDELNKWSSDSSNKKSDITPEDMFIVKELPGWMQTIAEFNNKLFGDEGKLLSYLAVLLLIAAIVKKIIDYFKKKTDALKEQTVKTKEETEAANALAPAFETVAATAAALTLALNGLPDSIPSLEPNLDLGLVTSQLEELENTFADITLPSLQPNYAIEPNTGLALKEIDREFKHHETAEMKPRFSWETVENFFEKVRTKWGALKTPALVPNFNINPITSAILSLSTKFNTFFAENGAKLGQLVADWKVKWNDGLNTVQNKVNSWSNTFKSSFTNALANAKQNVSVWVASVASSFGAWASNVCHNVSAASNVVATSIYNSLSNAAQNVAKWVTSTSQSFANWANNTASNIASWAKNVAENVGTALSNAWEKFKSFMRATGEKVGDWWDSGGKQLTIGLALTGIAIGAVALAAPTGGASLAALAFANGGVVDKPTYAMVGEYAGAKQNPEIISPEDKIRDLLSENNSTLIDGFAQMTRQVISAINNVDMNVSIGDDVIAKSAARGNNAYKRMTGTSLITN